MSTSTTLTIRIDQGLKEKLGQIAKGTHRSTSYIAAEALASYVERELEIIEGIQDGLADMQAGRVTPHVELMAEARALLAQAGTKAETKTKQAAKK